MLVMSYKLLKQKFVDESCKIMNQSDGEESITNWLNNFSSKNLKKKEAVYYN